MLQHMLDENKAIIDQYCQHPFNRQLYDGTLPNAPFMWFLQQDAIYLKAYASVLETISKRLAPEHPDFAAIFLQFKKETIEAEQYVNSEYLQKSALPFFATSPKIIAPAIKNYIDHLQATAEKGTINEAIVACYPCFYLYAELGKQNKGKYPSNKYSAWTDFYSDENFLKSTTRITDILDELTAAISEKERQQLIEVFKRSATFEVGFCNAAVEIEQSQESSLSVAPN
jgi:thiaminase